MSDYVWTNTPKSIDKGFHVNYWNKNGSLKRNSSWEYGAIKINDASANDFYSVIDHYPDI